jgi:hypothetical protein
VPFFHAAGSLTSLPFLKRSKRARILSIIYPF